MGRLPILYAGKPIIDRIPYQMDGKAILEENASLVSFDPAQYEHTVDKPFEIHRVLVRVIAMGFDESIDPVNNIPLEPQPTISEEMVQVLIEFISQSGQKLTKELTRPSVLVKNNTRVWEWDEPLTMARTDILGVTASSDSLIFWEFSTNVQDYTESIVAIQIEVAFQGFIVVVGPPQERSEFAPAMPAEPVEIGLGGNPYRSA